MLCSWCVCSMMFEVCRCACRNKICYFYLVGLSAFPFPLHRPYETCVSCYFYIFYKGWWPNGRYTLTHSHPDWLWMIRSIHRYHPVNVIRRYCHYCWYYYYCYVCVLFAIFLWDQKCTPLNVYQLESKVYT